MRIEVFITGWEQQCCGTPFGVGDEVTWTIYAEEPGRFDSDLPVFREEHHGQIPPHVPQVEVTGTVASIAGVSYVTVPEPGHSRSFIQTSTIASSRPVDTVGKGEDEDSDDYRVELDIAGDVELPTYAPWDENTQHADNERRAARSNDTVGLMLTSLADYAEAHYGQLAHVNRATDRPAISIYPHRDGAAAIHWVRSSREDFDGIHVEVGEGSWSFPSSVTQVATLASFLDAAANGRVEELVATPDPETKQLLTVIHSEDSETWTATVTVEFPASTNGSFAVVGTLWKRVQQGDIRYEPWDEASGRDPE